MDADQWDRMNMRLKKFQWEAKACWPISWKSVSLTLRHAANKLYEHWNDANNRILERIDKEIETHGKLREGSRTLEGQELIDSLDKQLIPVYFLLMGYAIENLLKGILMIRHPEYFKPDQKLIDIKSHDLIGLCRRCDIDIQKEEAIKLGRLTTYIEWEGKYPIPLTPDDMLPKRQTDGAWKTKEEGFHRWEFKQDVEILYNKFWNELERLRVLNQEKA